MATNAPPARRTLGGLFNGGGEEQRRRRFASIVSVTSAQEVSSSRDDFSDLTSMGALFPPSDITASECAGVTPAVVDPAISPTAWAFHPPTPDIEKREAFTSFAKKTTRRALGRRLAREATMREEVGAVPRTWAQFAALNVVRTESDAINLL